MSLASYRTSRSRERRKNIEAKLFLLSQRNPPRPTLVQLLGRGKCVFFSPSNPWLPMIGLSLWKERETIVSSQRTEAWFMAFVADFVGFSAPKGWVEDAAKSFRLRCRQHERKFRTDFYFAPSWKRAGDDKTAWWIPLAVVRLFNKEFKWNSSANDTSFIFFFGYFLPAADFWHMAIFADACCLLGNENVNGRAKHLKLFWSDILQCPPYSCVHEQLNWPLSSFSLRNCNEWWPPCSTRAINSKLSSPLFFLLLLFLIIFIPFLFIQLSSFWSRNHPYNNLLPLLPRSALLFGHFCILITPPFSSCESTNAWKDKKPISTTVPSSDISAIAHT